MMRPKCGWHWTVLTTQLANFDTDRMAFLWVIRFGKNKSVGVDTILSWDCHIKVSHL